MIKLTRLDGEAFVLNAELIRYVEAHPDTFITLSGGERVVVRESMDEVVIVRSITNGQNICFRRFPAEAPTGRPRLSGKRKTAWIWLLSVDWWAVSSCC